MFEPFVLTARAKVNLALHVLGRRADGYHELDSIVAFADVGDSLRFAPAPAFSITADGPFGATLPAAADNIIARAQAAVADLLAGRGLRLPPVAIHLTKNLPVASGIGGGSANAAEAMRGLLRTAGIRHVDEEILAAALRLGADVPVCLVGRACRMQGVGERIMVLPAFTPVHALLVNPGIALGTPEVFRQLGLDRGQSYGMPIADLADPAGWRNDLTTPAAALSPVIAEVIEGLHALPGISRAVMSGSGATCVAMFDSADAAGAARNELKRHHPAWWIEPARLA